MSLLHFQRQVYSTNLDNIDEVYYMSGEYNKWTGNKIPRRQITLEEEIARGRFAVIYKAKYSRGGNDAETVVAKVLHGKAATPITPVVIPDFHKFISFLKILI